MPGPENILRRSDVLLVMALASVEIKEGLSNPEVQKSLRRFPETLQKQIAEIVISTRSVFEKIKAIRKLAIPYVNEPDPENVLNCFPRENLRLVPPLEDDKSDNASQKHQKTKDLSKRKKSTNKPNLRIRRAPEFSDDAK